MPAHQSNIKVTNNMPKILKGFGDKGLDALGDVIGGMIETALVEKIHKGDSSWAPLSQAWAEYKGHGKQWYHTGTLGGAIKYTKDGNTVYIGIIDAGSYRDGENIATVAMKMEYGSGKTPARPLFRPVAEENEDEITKEAVAYVKDLIKKGKI